MEIQGELFSLSEVYKPRRPLCSETKDGTYKRRERSRAMAYPYIEANALCLQSLIVADVDGGDWWAYERKDLPAPSWRSWTHDDRSYHAVWALRDPVCLTDVSRRAPVNLLARVEAGLRRALEADESYGGRIMKNPTHFAHHTTHGVNNETDELLPAYSLRELAESLDYAHLLPKMGEKKALHASGVGRNVSLFDTTRHWAYRAVKRYWSGDTYADWEETVYAYALNKNSGTIADQWGEPLPTIEVKHLSRSVAKWIWRRFTAENLASIQSYRGEIQAQKRWGQKQISALETLETLGIQL